ncbi:hypothetical protein NODU109028_06855 [Nocardioides dubius]|uniref:Uncharacterized protein n=1 Tax=Nocardioides dubius TaxID=317019 RepID=A0ABP4E776_9ACTN
MLGLKVIVPLIVGSVLAVGASAGLVWSQTQAPSKNPADAQILTYGDQG